MFKIINGVPRHVHSPLEKLDMSKIREAQANDPIRKMQASGMTQKEAFIAYLKS